MSLVLPDGAVLHPDPASSAENGYVTGLFDGHYIFDVPASITRATLVIAPGAEDTDGGYDDTITGTVRYPLSFPPETSGPAGSGKQPAGTKRRGGGAATATTAGPVSTILAAGGSGGNLKVSDVVLFVLAFVVVAVILLVQRRRAGRRRRADEERRRASTPVVLQDIPWSPTPGPRIVRRLAYPGQATPFILVHPGAEPVATPEIAPRPARPAPAEPAHIPDEEGGPPAALADEVPTDCAGTGSDPMREPTDAAPAGESPHGESPPGADVDLLGPLVVRGCPAVVNRAKLEELLIRLTTHRHRPLTADELRAMVWAGQPVEASLNTLRTYISLLRQDLPPGSIPSAREVGGYLLATGVTTDWERFQALVVDSEATGDAAESMAALRSALGLVRDTPFAGVADGTYTWAFTAGDSLVSQMEAAIAETACRLAALALQDGQHVLAHWATSRGLLVSPYDEGLRADHLRAACGLGAGDLERAWRDTRATYGGEPPADLVALYGRLAGGPLSSAG
jgi:hypothetical protein